MTSAWEWIQSTSCAVAPILGVGGFVFPPLEIGAGIAGAACAITSAFDESDEDTTE